MKVGVTFGFTAIVIFTAVAHWPTSGVKLYVLVVVVGDQVPVIPLFDVVSSSLKASPSQISRICVKVGVTFGFTAIVIFTAVAHWSASGVKLYVVVVVVSKDGDQVPVIPLFEVVSSSLKASPEQIAGI